MDFSGLAQWQQDLIPVMVWWTMAGVTILTTWQIAKTVYRLLKHDRSAAD